jgi:hypothetical protein
LKKTADRLLAHLAFGLAERPRAFSNRASREPTSASTSPLLRPFAVSDVRAWLRTLRL